MDCSILHCIGIDCRLLLFAPQNLHPKRAIDGLVVTAVHLPNAVVTDWAQGLLRIGPEKHTILTQSFELYMGLLTV